MNQSFSNGQQFKYLRSISRDKNYLNQDLTVLPILFISSHDQLSLNTTDTKLKIKIESVIHKCSAISVLILKIFSGVKL